MATELALLNFTQPIPNHPNPPMWTNSVHDDDDDSWEVRAFEEDTGNVMGTTWPPRSYTCTFCRREFRSAQALGGHMNVHRRDRARLHQTQPISSINNPSSTSSSSTYIIPTQEFSTNGGLCLLYQIPNPNARVFTPVTMNACAVESPSTVLSVCPCPHNNTTMESLKFSSTPFPSSSSQRFSCRDEISASVNGTGNDVSGNNNSDDFDSEELDLELRLGHKSTESS